ncbi:DUF4178 domain-containing protein [Rubrivirga sp.]|uniref:DUF4178 domain-containing protein n=1 Tax=Rubrivirga sp. TaxID=1885344 RepID=UPI003C762F9E
MAELSALDRAIRAARRGHTDAAERLLAAVLEDDPHNELALVWRARLEDEPDIKAHRLRRVLNVNPGSRWATAQLAILEGEAPPSKTLDLDEIGTRPASLESLQCLSCAGQVEVHLERGSKAVVCTHCGTVLDVTATQLGILGSVPTHWYPVRNIRPGDEGTFEGARFVVAGWLSYEGWDSEDRWGWDEWQLVGDSGETRYLSFSADEGFLLQAPVRPTPIVTKRGLEVDGQSVRFYESSAAKIIGMAGELTWRPRLGAILRVAEARRKGIRYSVETTADEVEVVSGHPIPEVEVWEALGKPDEAQATRERVATLKSRSRFAAQVFLLSLVLGVAFGALTVFHDGASGGFRFDVLEVDTTLEVEPVRLPTDPDERLLALYDTVEVATLDLAAGRVYVLEAEFVSPVDLPRQLDAKLALWDPASGRLTRAGEIYSRASKGTREIDDYISSFSFERPETVILLALVQREWTVHDFEVRRSGLTLEEIRRGGFALGADSARVWRERATVPVTLRLKTRMSTDPLMWGAGLFLLLAIVSGFVASIARANAKPYG